MTAVWTWTCGIIFSVFFLSIYLLKRAEESRKLHEAIDGIFKFAQSMDTKDGVEEARHRLYALAVSNTLRRSHLDHAATVLLYIRGRLQGVKS